MKISLTDTFCKNITSKGAAQLDAFDAMTPGLALRVAKSGKKSWTFMFTVPGSAERARLALGTYPATALQDARTRATEARGLVEAGRDPRDAIAVETPKTISDLIEERLALKVRGKLDSAEHVERRYNKYVVPLIGNVAIVAFRIDPHYNRCLDPLVTQSKLRMAGVVHADLVTLMNFAVQRGALPYNPLAKTENPDPKNVRKRFLSVDEIVAFWRELPRAIVRSRDTQRILKLCLVTGQRVGEVSGMHRSELDLVKRLWTIPKARVKNDTDHAVPLSDLALEIIREAMAVNSNQSDWLFPNRAGTGSLTCQTVGNSLAASIVAGDFSIPHFTAHDLRRTVGTQMLNKANGLSIPKFDKYLVLNHRSATKGNVSDDVYDQNEYLDEKREALDKWGAFLAQLVGADQMREAA